MKFVFEERRFAREARDIEPGAILHLHAKNRLAAHDVHRNSADHSTVLALELLRNPQYCSQHAFLLAAFTVERCVNLVVHLRL